MGSSSGIPKFFVPGHEPGSTAAERAYAALRDAVGEDADTAPRQRRIFSVGCRVEGRDCVIEVGRPDPVEGSGVLAIFDVGGQEPYRVCTQTGAQHPALRVGKRVYSVTEFS